MRVTTHHRSRTASPRSGATLVETALISSVFGLFLAGIAEFGHCYMVIGSLNAAAKQAARYGTCEGISTEEVVSKALRVISATVKPADVDVIVKDAGIFDTNQIDPRSVTYESLPNIELAEAKPRQLYIVRVSVPYNKVALLPPFWVKNAVLSGQSVVRHE